MRSLIGEEKGVKGTVVCPPFRQEENQHSVWFSRSSEKTVFKEGECDPQNPMQLRG